MYKCTYNEVMKNSIMVPRPERMFQKPEETFDLFHPARQLTIRLDRRVLDYFRAR